MVLSKGVLVIIGVVFVAGILIGSAGSGGKTKPAPRVESATIQITETPAPKAAESKPDNGLVKVAVFIDGDTIEIEGGQRVRLIGINTPETVDPGLPVGCWGKEASKFTKSQLEGKEVRLEKDVSETDKYDRLLRYVWLDDILFNETLVKEGFALVSTYPPDVKYQELFVKAQAEARNANSGLWSEICQTPTQPVKAVVKDCRYSCDETDKDCGDFSTHAEAQTFFDCCGFSAGIDPMRLDKTTGTGNGLACESLP